MPGGVDQHQPAGLAQHRVRRALDDVDHDPVGQLAGDARIVHPAQLHDLRAQGGEIDLRHRPVPLAQHLVVDLELIEPLGAAHVHAVDLEAGVSGNLRDLFVHQQRQAGHAGDEPGEHRQAEQDQEQEGLVKLLFGEGQLAHQPVHQRAGFLLRLANLALGVVRPRLAADPGGLAADRLRHQRASALAGSLPKWRSASSMMISTSSP